MWWCYAARKLETQSTISTEVSPNTKQDLNQGVSLHFYHTINRFKKQHSLFDFIYTLVWLYIKTNWWKEVLWFFFFSGELWLGLEKLYKLTSEGNYSLRITLEDFDRKSYVAVFDQFKVITMMVNHVNDGAGWARRWLRAESGRFRRTLLHPRRLVDHSQPRWDEVQCQVREF